MLKIWQNKEFQYSQNKINKGIELYNRHKPTSPFMFLLFHLFTLIFMYYSFYHSLPHSPNTEGKLGTDKTKSLSKSFLEKFQSFIILSFFHLFFIFLVHPCVHTFQLLLLIPSTGFNYHEQIIKITQSSSFYPPSHALKN